MSTTIDLSTQTIEAVKVSDLPTVSSTSGLTTLATDSANKSKGLPLDFVSDAATAANNAAATANESATTANTAAAKADEAREAINDTLGSKANLDNEKRYVTPQQINPRQGKQQGVLTEYGYYYNGGNDFVLSGSQTHVVTFVTGEDVTSPQTVAAGKHFSFTLVVGGMNNAAIAPNTLYQAVYVIDAATSKGSMYLNGVLVSTGDVAAASEAFYIGKYRRDTPRIFKGTVISYRQFNSAMTSKDIADMWNNARPAEWRVPPALSDNCTVDFEPESLLPGSWRNLIKGGADILFYPYDPAFTYPESNYSPADWVFENADAKAQGSYVDLTIQDSTQPVAMGRVFEGADDDNTWYNISIAMQGLLPAGTTVSVALSHSGKTVIYPLYVQEEGRFVTGLIPGSKTISLIMFKDFPTTTTILKVGRISLWDTTRYDYTAAPPADDITIDSGVVYTDVSGAQRIILNMPFGYMPYGIGVQNFNAEPLTDVLLVWDNGGPLADIGTVPVIPASTARTGIRMAAPDMNNLLIAPTRPYARFVISATGNTPTGGMRVVIKCKWIGFYEKEN